jgi:hypothetical protein
VSLLATGETVAVTSPRLVVRMAPHSRARLLLDYSDDGSIERFVNSVLDVELGAGAELQVYRLQRQGDRAFHIDRVDADVGADARFVMRDSQLGSSLARLDLNVCLSGRAAQTQLTGVFLADGTDTSIHTCWLTTAPWKPRACRTTAASPPIVGGLSSPARPWCTLARRSRMLVNPAAICC